MTFDDDEKRNHLAPHESAEEVLACVTGRKKVAISAGSRDLVELGARVGSRK